MFGLFARLVPTTLNRRARKDPPIPQQPTHEPHTDALTQIPTLPPEIWIHIFENLTLHKSGWSALATTCRLFCTIARVHLFASIRLTSLNERWCSEQAVKIAGHAELSGLVRTVSLDVRPWHGHPTGVTTLRPTYADHDVLRRLPSFTGLTVLELHGFSLDAEFCNAVRALPRLRRIQTTDCTCVVDPALSEDSAPANVISELEIEYPVAGDGWPALAAGPALRTLIIRNGTGLSVSDAALHGFIKRGVHRTLTTLEWTPDGVVSVQLVRFLELCAVMRSLSVLQHSRSASFVYSPHVGTLSPGAMPVLSEFAGPAVHAGVFVRARPVHSVKLGVWEATPLDVLEALYLSSVNVTTLELVPYGRAYGKVHELMFLDRAPVTLQQLCLQGCAATIRDQTTVTSWSAVLCERLPRLEALQSLHVHSYYGALINGWVVQEISKMCPSVGEMKFVNEVWLKRSDGSWGRPYV